MTRKASTQSGNVGLVPQEKEKESVELKWLGRAWSGLIAVSGLLVMLGIATTTAGTAAQAVTELRKEVHDEGKRGDQQCPKQDGRPPRDDDRPAKTTSGNASSPRQISDNTPSAVASEPPVQSDSRNPGDDSAAFPRIPKPQAAATIKRPSPGESTSTNFVTVEGDFAQQSLVGELWVVVVPERAADFGWPQVQNANSAKPLRRDGAHFSVPAYLGGERPQRYEILLLAANSELASAFRASVRLGVKTGDYQGLSIDTIYAGANVLDRVKIQGTK